MMTKMYASLKIITSDKVKQQKTSSDGRGNNAGCHQELHITRTELLNNKNYVRIRLSSAMGYRYLTAYTTIDRKYTKTNKS